MLDQQIIKYIDNGANYYLKLFGKAENMEMVDNGFYTYIRPLEGQIGVNFVFDIRIENLSIDDQKKN